MKSFKGLRVLSIILIGYLVFTTGCYYDEILLPEIEVGDVSYSEDIQPYFDAECVVCHSAAGGAAPNLEAAVSYDILLNEGWVDIDNPSSSSLYISIAPGGSMATYSSPTETAMVLKWIELGANND
jgi:hypothetical protein